MRTLQIKTTEKSQVVDITDRIQGQLSSEGSGVVVVFVAHTTCALATADLDPGTDMDYLDALRNLLPDVAYRHPHDPEHTPDHILAAIIGPSVLIPFERGRLVLGSWQRVILFEFDGPRERDVHLTVVKE